MVLATYIKSPPKSLFINSKALVLLFLGESFFKFLLPGDENGIIFFMLKTLLCIMTLCKLFWVLFDCVEAAIT